MKNLDSRGGIPRHQDRHQGLLKITGPRNSNQKKHHGKGKMSQPREPPFQRNESQCDDDRCHCRHSTEWPPVWIGLAHWNNCRQECRSHQDGRPNKDPQPSFRDSRRRPVLPTLHHQAEHEQWHQQAVTVLGIDPPVGPYHSDHHEPCHPRDKQGQKTSRADSVRAQDHCGITHDSSSPEAVIQSREGYPGMLRPHYYRPLPNRTTWRVFRSTSASSFIEKFRI